MTGRPDPGLLAGMRVLELTQRYPPALGGVERYVERLARGLGDAGASVEVVTSDVIRDRPFTRGAAGRSEGTTSVRRHRGYLVAPAPNGVGVVVPGMVRDVLGGKIDLVHAHAFGHFPLWAGRLAQRLRGVPFVVTPHSDPGTGSFAGRVWSRSQAVATLRDADAVVALSRIEASWLTRLGVRPERVRVIPAGIDLEEFRDLSRDGRGTGLPTLLFVGRLDPGQKGLEPLVRALALLPREFPAQLRLVGEDWGGLAPAVALARRLGVAERLVLLGAMPRADLLREYAAATLVVLPSLFDSFPVVLLEAMATGLPVVATRVGGVPEIVEDGRSGLLVRPGDARALADAIAAMLGDATLRARCSDAGRRRAAEFDWTALVPRYVELFREVAARSRSARQSR